MKALLIKEKLKKIKKKNWGFKKLLQIIVSFNAYFKCLKSSVMQRVSGASKEFNQWTSVSAVLKTSEQPFWLALLTCLYS